MGEEEKVITLNTETAELNQTSTRPNFYRSEQPQECLLLYNNSPENRMITVQSNALSRQGTMKQYKPQSQRTAFARSLSILEM